MKAFLLDPSVDSTGKNCVLASNKAGFLGLKHEQQGISRYFEHREAAKVKICQDHQLLAKLRVIGIKPQLVDGHLGELLLLLI